MAEITRQANSVERGSALSVNSRSQSRGLRDFGSRNRALLRYPNKGRANSAQEFALGERVGCANTGWGETRHLRTEPLTPGSTLLTAGCPSPARGEGRMR